MMLPQIEVTPATAFIDVPVHITLSGFVPNQLITLHATLKNGLPGGDLTASSHAIFQADENGSVDLVSQAPLFGTYEGIDPMGLFWSMNVQTMRFYHAYSLDDFQFTPRSTEIELTAEVNDKPVAKAVVKRIFVSRDVWIQKVTDHGLVGLYFSKPHPEQRPAIVVLGGSEGGIGSCSQFAALFASHGYPALALAYFQCNDLPDDIRQIPIEYVQRAIHWLQQQPSVHPDKITLFGRSKGAELALVTASIDQHVHAVIALSPSSAVSIGTDKAFAGSDTFSPQSSWSFQGGPLPFVEIPVEKINGPILFLSSDDDHWWPAAEHCEQMVERLKNHQFAHSVVHLRYPDTGHGIRFPYIPTTRTQLNGGTPKNNAYASEHSWREVLQFLERTFPE
ncbi:acyl-CoA thioesterase/bile acid-CoA:amino acid N-acyltransferase family protein [Brevibacillus brevis]|uniref:acyl-CoA thioesterase/bile acid-CoA:amino acid N-acyltransferase family protein n=1 Tax=Brevibacillus brevis TaxID=1393 RepID=UPI0025A4F531|nr:acyl-CoA thioester hydrolase/BAAT C-terminal domain-containing protein [Brevibacillus brevis]WJQ84185.1 acyl-CoA thioester hydrolase/BAAT C-terminal domain-containing protein [Brevibacillus brevis]